MKLTVAVLLLVSSCVSSKKANDKTEPSKTDKRDLLEGNYGDRTYLKNVLRSIQGVDFTDSETEITKSHAYSPSSHRIAKISDVLTSEGPHYSTISDHLFSPVSAYQSRFSSPTLGENSELTLADLETKHKPSKKHSKKPKSSPKRTYHSYDPSRTFQYDSLSNFANYQHDLSNFRNFYQEPHHTFDKTLFTPSVYAQQSGYIHSSARPVATPQYYPHIYQRPLSYPNQGITLREFAQPLQYLQQSQAIPRLAYAQEAQHTLPTVSYAQGVQQVVPGVAYAQSPQRVVPSLAYAQGPQHVVPSYSYAQGAQQVVPSVAYAQNPQQVIPGIVYAQGAQQVVPHEAYAQGAQQLVPGVAYVQSTAQVPGVTYAQQPHQQAEATAQPQPIRVAEQQQASQQQVNVQHQHNQGAVSYASFSQSLPFLAQGQQYAQEQQVTPIQYVQTQTQHLPSRPDHQAQPLPTPIPDSQPQPQQIAVHPVATIQPIHEQSVLHPLHPLQPLTSVVPLQQTYITHVQSKPELHEQQVQASPHPQPEASNQQSTVQPPPQPTPQVSTEASVQVTTEHSQSQPQQIVQEITHQPKDHTVAVEKEVTYIQQVPSQVYSQGLVYQQPGLVHAEVAPSFPSVQYFGNFAESLFRNDHH